MARGVSIAARNAAQAVHTDDGFLLLLTAWPKGGETLPLYVVNNNADIVSRGLYYTAWPFEISLPSDDDERVTQATIVIDNVDGTILETFRAISSEVNVKLEVVLMSNPDDVVMATNGLLLRRIQVDDARITGDLVVDVVYHVAYPGSDYTPATTPGIFR